MVLTNDKVVTPLQLQLSESTKDLFNQKKEEEILYACCLALGDDAPPV